MECLSFANAFDYIALRINPGTISCRQWLVSVMLATFYHIKTSGSESRGQEEAACSYKRLRSGLRDHHTELRMAALSF